MPAGEELEDRVVRALEDAPKGTVLDIGCGYGRFSVIAAKAGRRVHAVDRSREAMAALATDAAREGLAIDCIQEDARRFTYPATYSTVLCINLLHYLAGEDRQKVVAAMQARTCGHGIHVVAALTGPGPGTEPLRAQDLLRWYAGWELRCFRSGIRTELGSRDSAGNPRFKQMAFLVATNACSHNRLRPANDDDAPRVRDFFIALDSEFFPPLSQRPGGAEGYLRDPLKHGRVALCERDGAIIAASAYAIRDRELFMGLTAVHPAYRQTPVLYRLLRYIAAQAPPSIDRIRLRTASLNHKLLSLLPRFGFERIAEIQGHLSPDRVTFEYAADSQTAFRALLRVASGQPKSQHTQQSSLA